MGKNTTPIIVDVSAVPCNGGARPVIKFYSDGSKRLESCSGWDCGMWMGLNAKVAFRVI